MIAMEFQDGQGLGNQLWVYVVCRSIAEKLDIDFTILNYEKFKGADFLDLSRTNSKCELRNPTVYNERMFFDSELGAFIYDFDPNVLTNANDFIIRGIFQSEKYFDSLGDQLNRYIKIKPDALNSIDVQSNTCILYIRGGEYKRHKNLILPKSYWTNAMSNMQKFIPNVNFKIVSDDDRYCKSLFPDIEILPGDMSSDFVALFKAKYVILSNSSWGYFPVKLGLKPEIVIAPMYWARFGNEYERWVSPANCYSEWKWQDSSGKIVSDSDLAASLNKTLEYYNSSFYILTNNDAVLKNKSKFLNQSIRNKIKSALGLIIPRMIG